MHIEELRARCLSKPGTTEEFPFGDDVLVWKVAGKMYALCSLERLPLGVNLKCDPARALDLRDLHEGIQPGYHMSKKHWNTITFESDVPSQLLCELIDHSYDLVVSKLPKKTQATLIP